MAISSRIKRLFRADVNAILDVIEEPDTVLKQAIRDMQEALDGEKGLLARCQKNLNALQERSILVNEQLTKAQRDLDLCLREGSEELCRKAIGRKLSCEKILASVKRKISNLEQLSEEKRRKVEVQQAQLESIVDKAATYVGTITEDSPYALADSILASSEHGLSPLTAHVTEEEIELEWIRIRNEGGES